jgi:hypothetical protein
MGIHPYDGVSYQDEHRDLISWWYRHISDAIGIE